MALTGQLEIISSQLQSVQSSDMTFDFPSSILNTFGQSASQVPQPMQSSSFTFAFGIKFLNLEFGILNFE
jgi:hypothetical protein